MYLQKTHSVVPASLEEPPRALANVLKRDSEAAGADDDRHEAAAPFSVPQLGVGAALSEPTVASLPASNAVPGMPSDLVVQARLPESAIESLYISALKGAVSSWEAFKQIVALNPPKHLDAAATERLRGIMQGQVVLCPRDAVAGLSEVENRKLANVVVTRSQLVQVFQARQSTLCGSAARHVMDPNIRFNDIDFSLHMSKSWDKARPEVENNFATLIFQSAGIDRRPTPDEAKKIFSAFARDARMISNVFKIRLNGLRPCPPHVLPIDITAKPPYCKLPPFDEIGASYTVNGVLNESGEARYEGPPAQLATWLHHNRVRWFSEGMLGGFQRLVLRLRAGAFVLIQPHLEALYRNSSSPDELGEAFSYLLKTSWRIRLEVVVDLRRKHQDLHESICKKMTADLLPNLEQAEIPTKLVHLPAAEVEQIVNNYLSGKQNLYEGIRNHSQLDEELLLPTLQAYFQGLQWNDKPLHGGFSKLVEHCINDDHQALRERIADLAFPLISAKDLVQLWQTMAQDITIDRDTHFAQRILLVPALRHYEQIAGKDPYARLLRAILHREKHQSEGSAYKFIDAIAACRRADEPQDILSIAEPALQSILDESRDVQSQLRISAAWFEAAPTSLRAKDALVRAMESASNFSSIDAVKLIGDIAVLVTHPEEKQAILRLCQKIANQVDNSRVLQTAVLYGLHQRNPHDEFWTEQFTLRKNLNAMHAHLDAGDLSAAKECAQAALAADSSCTEAIRCLAHAFLKTEKFELAKAHFLKCIELSGTSQDPNDLNLLAQCHVFLKEYESAYSIYKTVERISPNAELLARNLVELFNHWNTEGDKDVLAIQEFRALLELCPQHVELMRAAVTVLSRLVKNSTAAKKEAYLQELFARFFDYADVHPHVCISVAMFDSLSEHPRLLDRSFLELRQRFIRTNDAFYFVGALITTLVQAIELLKGPQPDADLRIVSLRKRISQLVAEVKHDFIWPSDSHELLSMMIAVINRLASGPQLIDDKMVAEQLTHVFLQIAAKIQTLLPAILTSRYLEDLNLLAYFLFQSDSAEAYSVAKQCFELSANRTVINAEEWKKTRLAYWSLLMKRSESFLLKGHTSGADGGEYIAQSMEILMDLCEASSENEQGANEYGIKLGVEEIRADWRFQYMMGFLDRDHIERAVKLAVALFPLADKLQRAKYVDGTSRRFHQFHTNTLAWLSTGNDPELARRILDTYKKYKHYSAVPSETVPLFVSLIAAVYSHREDGRAIRSSLRDAAFVMDDDQRSKHIQFLCQVFVASPMMVAKLLRFGVERNFMGSLHAGSGDVLEQLIEGCGWKTDFLQQVINDLRDPSLSPDPKMTSLIALLELRMAVQDTHTPKKSTAKKK